MHHFSVASLVELTAAGNGFEWAILMAIAENSWLLSSGFAEGKPGHHILTPTMRGVPADGGITVSGVKKPCSLTWSMNLMSASVAVADPPRNRPAGRRADTRRVPGHRARGSGGSRPWPARKATRSP